MDAATPLIETPQPIPNQAVQKKMPIIVIILIALLVVITAGVGWAYYKDMQAHPILEQPISPSPAVTSVPTIPMGAVPLTPTSAVISPTGTVINGPGTGSICGTVQGPSGGNSQSVLITVTTLDGTAVGKTTTNSSGEFTISVPTGKLVVYSQDSTSSWMSSVDQVVVPEGVCQKMYIMLQSQLDSGMGRPTP